MTETNGYKVVARWPDGHLTSCIVRNTYLSTEYVPGEPVSNEHGPILLFDNLENATLFVRTHKTAIGRDGRRAEIWSCAATNARKVGIVIMPHFFHNLSPAQLKQWWDEQSRPNDVNAPISYLVSEKLLDIAAPAGTLAADSVTLIERVDKE